MIRKIFLAIQAIFFFVELPLHAQVAGCTDPLASNFNAAATVNDGSCLYNNASISPAISVNLPAVLSETSGLVQWSDKLLTHNDNTDISLYSVDTLTGLVLQTYNLPGIVNVDWEDISQDSLYIYVGDFGNNANGNRTNLRIFRIDKNTLTGTPVIDTINFVYGDQTNFSPTGANNTDFDCEAFIVTTDSIYLFTKQWVSNQTGLYALPKAPGNHIANFITTYNISGLVTGATLMELGKVIVLCGYSNLLQPFLFLLYDYSGNDFFSGNKRKISISLPFHQVEGISTVDGLKYFISNEYFSQPPIITVAQQFHTLDLIQYLGTYLNGLSTSMEQASSQDRFIVYPNPANDYIDLFSPISSGYRIINATGTVVLYGTITKGNSRISINQLPAGIYTFDPFEVEPAGYRWRFIKD